MESKCKNLEKLLHRLDRLENMGLSRPYFIPALWHYEDTQGAEEVEIDPISYFRDFITTQLYSQMKPEVENYLLPLSRYNNDEKWLINGGIYCIDVRTATSWDHDGDKAIVQRKGQFSELGTFFKTLFILPHLKRLRLDILYLLPVLKPSTSYPKGELGSFYSIKNFYELNPDFHDPFLDISEDKFSIETEFRALVEACHLLGIRVVFDFPLRTAARDNDLLVKHPDWFYWVYKKDLSHYQVPYYKTLDEHVQPTVENLQHIYGLPETAEYIKLFSFPPNEINEEDWVKIKTDYAKNPDQNILEMIEQQFGITTAPAYSDWINDPQPSWDDITFLKLYLDPPAVRDGYFKGCEPPFLFFDAIKTNLYPGKEPNEELWDYLTGIIRYYQENFGIDGARIDMAHALPEDLEKLIMEKTLTYDPHFKFISEELQNKNHMVAQKKGYHSIIGETWYREGRLNSANLIELLEELPLVSLPSFACAETPDTPRAAVRQGGREFSRMVAVLNFFLPNTIPFINNGFELYERQPMNLGLDNTEAGRYMLEEDDPYYGRLAFFDRFRMHWSTKGALEMVQLINKARELRAEHWVLLSDCQAFYLLGEITEDVVRFGYRRKGMELACFINLSFTHDKPVETPGRVLISSALNPSARELKAGEFRVCLLK